jgi:sugar transferase (PEP-CTERM/EpsH1 system associated)
MPVRVLHVVHDLGRGGLETGLVNVIERLDPRRFEHIVCAIRALGVNADRLSSRGIKVVSLADRGGTARFQTWALIRLIRQTRPDVVHSRNWTAIESVLAGRLARVRAVVHSQHGFEADANAREPRRRVVFSRLAFELADRVMTVSFQLRDFHARRTGFPARRIGVIHNGVDADRFTPDAARRASMRVELGLGDDTLCIGCVANLLPVKDHVTLLNAAGRLTERGLQWRLLLIGDGPEQENLETFVERHPELKGRVRFLGSTSRVAELLQAMDVFVMPSIAEGICNSLLEAMATGVPVVATAVGGTPEVIVDGQSGMLVPARDAATLGARLVQIWSQPDLRRQLGRNARQRVRDEFSIEAMVRAYDNLYSSGQAVDAVPVLSAEYR